jgi:predicted DNA-binding protein
MPRTKGSKNGIQNNYVHTDIRLDARTKSRLIELAKKTGQTLSEYLREKLQNIE